MAILLPLCNYNVTRREPFHDDQFIMILLTINLNDARASILQAWMKFEACNSFSKLLIASSLSIYQKLKEQYLFTDWLTRIESSHSTWLTPTQLQVQTVAKLQICNPSHFISVYLRIFMYFRLILACCAGKAKADFSRLSIPVNINEWIFLANLLVKSSVLPDHLNKVWGHVSLLMILCI